MITVMGIKARANGWDIDGAELEVKKLMASEPRRISEIHIRVIMPAQSFDDKIRKILENTGRTCPVALSLHPDIKQLISFEWQ
jgi:uncharacterized OsmC-like protein